jgi:DNA-binding MurR/RpiR family transcriptional regulator
MVLNQIGSLELEELLKKINEVSKLSATNKKLAGYITQNYMKIIFMTAGHLADTVGVSQGSVTRFCVHLNYKGYNDFLQNLQLMVRKEITLSQKYEFNSHGNSEDISNILEKEHGNIDLIADILKHSSYQSLKNKIIECERLILISARMSATLLPYAFYMFNKIKDGVVLVTPDSPMWSTVNLINNKKSTLVLAFVFPRYCNSLLEKLRQMKQEGYDVAAITDADFLSIKGFVDSYIRIPITVTSVFDIYSTPMLFINLLLRDVSNGIKGLEKRIAAIDRMEQENNIYYSGE